MGIKQRPLPKLATSHVKWLFFWAHRELNNGHQRKARYISSISETPDVHLRLHYLDEMRRVYFMRVSTQLVFVTGIKQ
jgi:hypothetical protein